MVAISCSAVPEALPLPTGVTNFHTQPAQAKGRGREVKEGAGTVSSEMTGKADG